MAPTPRETRESDRRPTKSFWIAVSAVALASFVGGACAGPPGPDRWQATVDRLDSEVLPVVQALSVSLYLLTPGPCRIFEYPGGNFRDGGVSCKDVVILDARAREDFERMTAAIVRSGVAVERIFRNNGSVYVRIPDSSWQYNWSYVYGPDPASPPRAAGSDEQWTHVRGRWWFHREHDD